MVTYEEIQAVKVFKDNLTYRINKMLADLPGEKSILDMVKAEIINEYNWFVVQYEDYCRDLQEKFDERRELIHKEEPFEVSQ